MTTRAVRAASLTFAGRFRTSPARNTLFVSSSDRDIGACDRGDGAGDLALYDLAVTDGCARAVARGRHDSRTERAK